MKILRPGPSEVQLVDSYTDAESPNPNSRLYKVLHQEKTAKLWNHAFKEHSQKFPDCVHWTGTSMGRKREAWHGSFPFDVRSAITPVTVKSCTRKSVNQEGDGEPHSLMLPWLLATWLPALQQRICMVYF